LVLELENDFRIRGTSLSAYVSALLNNESELLKLGEGQAKQTIIDERTEAAQLWVQNDFLQRSWNKMPAGFDIAESSGM